MALKKRRASKLAPNRVELVYKLDGELREIDVFRLAPALTGIGELIQSAHLELRAEHEVGVNVKPFGRGSFVVEISLFVKDNLPVIGLSAATVATAITHTTQILEAIGMIKSKTESLISAIRKLRGKPTDVEPVGANEYRYRSPGGDVTVNGSVHQLIQNATIHQAVTHVYGKPTEQEGVTGIETFLQGREQETKVVVGRDEARVFEEFSNNELPNPSPIEEHVSAPTTYYLKPKRLSLEGESDNWSFRYGANQTLHVDVVRDEDFLDNVKKGQYRLSSDDLIVAEIIQKQKVRGTEIIGDPRYELIKIVEYRSAPRNQQEALFKDNLTED
jgi:hypothetical protein